LIPEVKESGVATRLGEDKAITVVHVSDVPYPAELQGRFNAAQLLTSILNEVALFDSFPWPVFRFINQENISESSNVVHRLRSELKEYFVSHDLNHFQILVFRPKTLLKQSYRSWELFHFAGHALVPTNIQIDPLHPFGVVRVEQREVQEHELADRSFEGLGIGIR
jgi:hypothetical protein